MGAALKNPAPDADRKRLEEIEEWLAAYRAHWLHWDKEHVQNLKSERVKLQNKLPK